MAHSYKCYACQFSFTVPDNSEYDKGSPQDRDCPQCQNAKGNIGYMGQSSRHNVISDSIGDIRSTVDGKTYDSKSNLRKSYKAHGVIEMGSDAKAEERKEIRGDYDCRPALAQAIEQTGLMEKLRKGEKVFDGH